MSGDVFVVVEFVFVRASGLVVKSSQVVGLHDRVAIIRTLIFSSPHPYAGSGERSGIIENNNIRLKTEFNGSCVIFIVFSVSAVEVHYEYTIPITKQRRDSTDAIFFVDSII